MSKRYSIPVCVTITLVFIYGCAGGVQGGLTVRGGKIVTYGCENGDRIVARYYSLSDESLGFVKVLMPDGREHTLPRVLSGSGARYTDDVELVWWIKGDSALVEMRDRNGQWDLQYRNCRIVDNQK